MHVNVYLVIYVAKFTTAQKQLGGAILIIILVNR